MSLGQACICGEERRASLKMTVVKSRQCVLSSETNLVIAPRTMHILLTSLCHLAVKVE